MKDRRGFFREGLHDIYVPYYDKLCAALPDAWAPTQGLRTFEAQALLYAQGRTQAGPVVTNAAPGLSLHQYGLASDWDYFPDGKYTPLSASDSRWAEYERAVVACGLRSISWEKPHNELPLSFHARKLLEAYNDGGMASVTALIRGDGHG